MKQDGGGKGGAERTHTNHHTDKTRLEQEKYQSHLAPMDDLYAATLTFVPFGNTEGSHPPSVLKQNGGQKRCKANERC